MQSVLEFVQTHQLYFDAAQALSSIVSVVGWVLGAIILTIAWRNNAIHSVNLGPFGFQVQDAVTAAATAARDWQAKGKRQKLNVAELRSTVARAFEPEIADLMAGKSILWVDDNPTNNMLAMRALEKLRLDVDQEPSTEAGLAAMKNRRYDLVISDMGRGTDMQAGYDLLRAIRANGNDVPFFIFAGSDSPQFRFEAKQRGAQLSTNDMLELIDNVIDHLAT